MCSLFPKTIFYIFIRDRYNDLARTKKKFKDAVFRMSLQEGNVMRKYIFIPEMIRYFKNRHLLLLDLIKKKHCVTAYSKILKILPFHWVQKSESFAAMENEYPYKNTCTVYTQKL